MEKIGVCTEFAFARYVLSGRRLGPEPRLWLEDAELGRVPVRVYRPRAPPAGPRVAAIFFHGGGWVCGSTGTAGRDVERSAAASCCCYPLEAGAGG